MTPILYEKDEIDFTSQGLGSLVEIYDADVAEQRNGLLQFTASYPVTGVRYDDISVGRIILAKPNQRDEPHAFRITIADLDIMGHNVMIEADSITYDLNHNIVKHVSANGQSGQAMMTALQMAVVNPSIFTFYSDITHVSSTSLDYVNPMEAVMGVKGSFLQIWGGELKRENRRVAMFNRRGRDNVATFRLGKNISGLKYKVDISSLVTRILPIKSVQENDTTTYLEGTPVSSQYINSYEQIYTIKVDFTDDTIKTVDDLNKASANWFVDSANTARDKPSVTIDIDVLSLQDSADYQDKFKDLESVALTDTVTVYVPEYGINVTAIVNELHFDPIQERVTKLTVGTAKQSFADSSRTQLSDLQDKIISVQNQADATAVSANGKSTNYYGSVEPSHPQGGDTWFWVDGYKSGIKVFVNGDWVEPVDSDTQEKIEDAVTDAVSQAKAYSNQLVATNREQVNAVLDDVQAKQADLTAKQAELDTKAQGYANKALSDAKADTLATATQTAKDASDALAKAKTDLTTSLNKEVTDRTKAVSDLDTKAQGYATQAKIDAQSALDALQVGGRNYLVNTNGTTLSGWSAPSLWSVTTDTTRGSVFMGKPTTNWTGGGTNALSQVASVTPGSVVMVSFYAKADIDNARFHSEPQGTVVSFNPRLTTNWVRYNYTFTMGANNQRIYFMPVDAGTTYYLDDVKLEIGNKATDYTQAPEDIVLDYTTKDNVISQSLTQYQATNDGKVTKAQSDATLALGLVATKVSQTTFDTKTGDLDSKYTAIKQTADQASTDIVAIKSTNTSQDTKINTLTSDVSGTKQSISDIQTEQGAQSTKINTIQTDVSGTKQDISDIQDANGVQDGKIASISTTVDGLSSSFSTYKTTNDGKVAKAQADIIVNANAITQKVSQSDYNAKTGDLTTKVNTAQSTADSATSTIGAYKTANDARVASAESNITANATAITQKVSQTDYNTKTGQIDEQISTINQTAGKISQTVSDVKAQVDGLSVGGRNLLLNSKTLFGSASNGGTITKEAFDATTNMWHITSPLGSGDNRGLYFNIANNTSTPIPVGQPWTMSFDIKGTGLFRQVGPVNSTTKGLTGNVPADWARVSATGIRTTANNIVLYFDATTIALDIYIKLPKLEIGNLPTGWTPAPEDTDNKISTVSQTVDSISSIVSDPATGLTKRVQTAEGSISTVQSNVSDLQSKQTQTASGLTTEISNRATGDTNTLTQAKDFTTSSISNSESGMRSLITQTSDSIIAKVDTKTDSATVLSLLKDNWSIGITGNTNKLASGIAADPNAMNIVSPKVIISSPQTQITGTAWIKTAMIADGQISTAKIGDASITSAKIADLDVSKITGNVSNFIQSNWNGVYESTTITNNGMQIVTSDITTSFDPRGIKLTQGGESVGGIGVSSYVEMPTNFQGIAFNLDGTGDYMTWSARESGVTTGDYTTKLAWFRSSYKPIGQNAGFNFSPDSPVTFWGDIYGRENTEPLKIASFGMKGISAGGLGHGNGSSAITFGGDGEIYIVSGGKYYKLAEFVKALQPLIGLGTWSAPKNINSNGVVTQWTNVTT